MSMTTTRNATIKVLVLGGWSPGPLSYLKRRFRSDRFVFVEPAIPMPPMGFAWCWDPFCLLLVVNLVFTSWLCNWLAQGAELSGSLAALTVAGTLIVAAGVARLCVAGLVRGAMRVGARRSSALIRQHNYDMVVGFSWGGGVAAQLLLQGKLGTQETPAVLLLAPTTAAMGRFAMRPDAASSIQVEPGNRNRVVVFHASDDGFCPDAQRVRWEATGATAHTCHDSHVFEHTRSLDVIADAFLSMCGAGSMLE